MLKVTFLTYDDGLNEFHFHSYATSLDKPARTAFKRLTSEPHP
jgi:hypothetical protein